MTHKICAELCCISRMYWRIWFLSPDGYAPERREREVSTILVFLIEPVLFDWVCWKIADSSRICLANAACNIHSDYAHEKCDTSFISASLVSWVPWTPVMKRKSPRFTKFCWLRHWVHSVWKCMICYHEEREEWICCDCCYLAENNECLLIATTGCVAT